MGKRYTLQDAGYPAFKWIVRGRQRVGRVARHAEGGYVGVIGNSSYRAASETEAFREIAARDMGYSCAAELEQRNRAARQATRAVNAAADAVGAAFLSGDPAQLRQLNRVLDSPAGALLAIRGVGRALGMRSRRRRG